jgi:cytoskeletal protein CcmA (bactofilin family)
MSDFKGVLLVGADAVLKGEVANGRRVEVHGYVEGQIAAKDIVVHPDGRLFGQIKADSAEVRGTLQGDVRVQNLIAIRNTGTVNGTVKYGRLSIDEGGELSAHVRNVPPSISGDLDLTVARRGSVRITRADLSAEDPDDAAHDLTFTVSNARGGFVSLASSPAEAAGTFSQAALEAGQVLFVHDGGDSPTARFDVVVNDVSGNTSGPPKTVNVAIRG